MIMQMVKGNQVLDTYQRFVEWIWGTDEEWLVSKMRKNVLRTVLFGNELLFYTKDAFQKQGFSLFGFQL